MNRSFNGGARVHRGLRLTPTSELIGAHAPRQLRPRGLTGMASTQRGASGEPHQGLWRPTQRRGKASDKEERTTLVVLGVGLVEAQRGEAEVGRGVVGCYSARGAFYRPGGSGGGGEAAGGGGFLILVGFNIESGRGVEEAPT
jgi:hypothetical protein